MKNLHKKIGAGALVVVLLGAPVAHASMFRGIHLPGGRMVHQNPPISKQADLKVPFLLGSQLEVASEKQIEENDKNMVYGLSGIFDYVIYKVGNRPSDDEIKKNNYMVDLGKVKGGNEFLRLLVNRNLSSGKSYIIKVGKLDYEIQFNKDSKRNRMWWLDLDKWQYGAKVFFESHGIKY